MWVGGSSESIHAVEVGGWVVNPVAPIERGYQCGNRDKRTYLCEGLMMQKNATHAKVLTEKATLKGMAARTRGEVTVGSGRRRNEGYGAPQTRSCCSGSRAPLYGPRVGRWYLQAFGCVFDLDHHCTRSHLGDWPDCMGRTLGERRHISMRGNRKVSAGSERSG